MLIREVILENFMSYEYVRLPLKKGVNVVVGPNGSGKSSLLLGICVALGETYTERSKRLSDLIRWGKDFARISLFLDNSANQNGMRPAPQYDMDEIRLTRNLRKDGKYWFELNQRTVQKYEVTAILRRLGFDPENMLIIMHQNMPELFANISSQEKLKTLETAVGYQSFREDVVESKRKLSGILSEEESLNQLLDRARETLNHWREQYERLQEKRKLRTRNLFLQREMAWSRVAGLEGELARLEQEIDKADADLYQAEREMETYGSAVVEADEALRNYREKWLGLLEKRIKYERTVGVCEYAIASAKERLAQVGRMMKSSRARRQKFVIETENLRAKLKEGPTTLDDYFTIISEIEDTQTGAYDEWQSEMSSQRRGAEEQLESLTDRLTQAETEVLDTTNEMDLTQASIDETNDKYIESRIRLALLRDKRGRLRRRIEEFKAEIERLRRDLNDAEAEALIRGPRVDTGRSSEEILGEIRKTSGILLGLSDVSEEAEEMYGSYSRTFSDLQAKIELVRTRRREVMEEIEERTSRWLEVTRDLLDNVNVRYRSLISRLQARGEVRLINSRDIEEAGLEIYVGFRGAQQTKLDTYTHSGGERSTSIVAFLLSIQQNILSPFRAIDEFDLHMDPRNREIVSEFIVSTLEGSDDQYMVITPSQVFFNDEEVHIVMVHKTEGASTAQEVDKDEQQSS